MLLIRRYADGDDGTFAGDHRSGLDDEFYGRDAMCAVVSEAMPDANELFTVSERIAFGAVLCWAVLLGNSHAVDGLFGLLHVGAPKSVLVRPNVELTGPRRHGALAVRPMMKQGGRTARVPCCSGSG